MPGNGEGMANSAKGVLETALEMILT
jgi:hypothetical protein